MAVNHRKYEASLYSGAQRGGGIALESHVCTDYLFVHRNMQLLFLCIFKVYKVWKVEAAILHDCFLLLLLFALVLYLKVDYDKLDYENKTKWKFAGFQMKS